MGYQSARKKIHDERKVQLADYINIHIKPEIVRMSEDAGRRVLYTPPHRSDLQLIKLLWA